MARIDAAYNYFMTTYGDNIGSRYESHKKSELRDTYNKIAWTDLWLYALLALMCWAVAALLSLRGGWHRLVCLLTAVGLLVFGSYIGLMWYSLGHPPLRTMGETRLWYSFFLPLVGLMAVWQLLRGHDQLPAIDNLTRVGVSFLTIGMLFGALWAKEAWGTYWSWDPKETWAAATWLCYLIYLHLRRSRPEAVRPALLWLLLCFVCLQMCWWGINYLPSAQGISAHTY